MAIEYGFFDSKNGDRKYSADQMTRPYDRLVSDGVISEPSDQLKVTHNTADKLNAMSIKVQKGRGLFFGKWIDLDETGLILNLTRAHDTLKRIDSIIIRVSKEESERSVQILLKTGTPATTPQPYKLVNTSTVKEYRLAKINVNAGCTDLIDNRFIEDCRPTNECGYVIGLLKQIDTATAWDHFNDDFYSWFNDIKTHFTASVLMYTMENIVVTTSATATTINIGISEFDPNLDTLQVFINGMKLDNTEYTATKTICTLTKAVSKGTKILFVVYRTVDGKDAKTAIDALNTFKTTVANTYYSKPITNAQIDTILKS